MDIAFETTGATAAEDIAASSTAAPRPLAEPKVLSDADPRVVALRAAATALLPAVGLADEDSADVSLAMSDEPGWAVIRVAKVVREG
jgi:hypothetical protein